MGFFDYIADAFGYQPKNKRPVIKSDGLGATYSNFGTDIYASEIVAQSVQCIANEIKKLEPRHVIVNDNETTVLNDDIGRVLEFPNEIMTMADFLEQIVYLLMRKGNVFIYPTYIETVAKRVYTGLFPLKPAGVEFVEDASGTLFVRFRFNNGIETILPYADIIHWRYRFEHDDFMGGNGTGELNNASLIETLQFNKTVRASMDKAANAPINGIVKYGSVISENKLADEVARFDAMLKNSQSGILSLDAKSEFTQVAQNIKIVDTDTMEFIKQEIVDHFGVSLPMLHSKATMEEKQAFYDKTIEPMVKSLNQAFTRCLITQGRRDRNHKIVFYEKDLLFMTMDQKISFIETVAPLGALTNNQILGIFGFPPYDGGDVRVQSLNNVDANIANDYQMKDSAQGGAGNGQEDSDGE